MVAACGYKGPLYMPTPDGKPPARSQPSQQPATQIPPPPPTL
ncbi:lipoprotein [Achromobacter sp. NPDC058515]